MPEQFSHMEKFGAIPPINLNDMR